MVTVEKRIQQAIKEILEEETWKHLKTNNNFDKVLSVASLIDPFDCLLYTSPSPRDAHESRMPSSA